MIWEASYADCLMQGGGALDTILKNPLKTQEQSRLHSKSAKAEELRHEGLYESATGTSRPPVLLEGTRG